MRHALNAGVNWIDTAASGLGQSEELVGEFLRALPIADRPFVFTSGGLLWNPRQRMADLRRAGKAASLRRECEASLRRLGVERIDLYRLQWPDRTGTAIEELWTAMTRLIEQGKVRAAGVSNVDVRLLDRCEAIRHVDAVQPPFSLVDRTAAESELPWCASHDTAVIVCSPMQSGLLTDTFTADRASALAGDDWRRLELEFRLREALRPIAKRHAASVSAIAIAWTLAWPGVTGAVLGARTPEQMAGWIDAASIALAPEDVEAIAAAIRHTGAGSGPVTSARPAALPQTVAR
jgi:aryl-alcohol dehydrogenase-like predicted oxidoreductase